VLKIGKLFIGFLLEPWARDERTGKAPPGRARIRRKRRRTAQARSVIKQNWNRQKPTERASLYAPT
jgi:hypothetical protein